MAKFEQSADRDIKDLTRQMKQAEENSMKTLKFFCVKESTPLEEFFGLFSSFLVHLEKCLKDNDRDAQRADKMKQLKEKRATRKEEQKKQSGKIGEKPAQSKFEAKKQARKKGNAMDNVYLTIRSGAAFPTRQESGAGNTVRRTVAKRAKTPIKESNIMNLFVHKK